MFAKFMVFYFNSTCLRIFKLVKMGRKMVDRDKNYLSDLETIGFKLNMRVS